MCSAYALGTCPVTQGATPGLKAAGIGLLTIAAGCGEDGSDEINQTDSVAQQPLTVESTKRLRVGHLNTHLIPMPLDPSGDDWVDKANAIADSLLADPAGYDVIALNEVLNQEASDQLASRLQSTYPHWVRDIDGNNLIGSGGGLIGAASGIAFFSKLPFQPLPNAAGSHVNLTASNPFYAITNTENQGRYVAFQEFDESCMPDTLASKGAALVRVRVREHDFNIVSTHMQSDDKGYGTLCLEDDDVVEVRSAQFKQIDQLLQSAGVNLVNPLYGTTLLSGDMNVQGWPYEYSSTSVDVDNPPTAMKFAEYGFTTWGGVVFDGPGKFFDVWRTTSVADEGITYPGSPGRSEAVAAQRLDYFLLNGAGYFTPGASARVSGSANTYCPTWNRLAFRESGSDHRGLALELAPTGPGCSPWKAYVMPTTLPAGEPFHRQQVTVTQPGQSFWVRLQEAGTYSVAVRDASQGVRADVFAESDLGVTVPRSDLLSDTNLGDYGIAKPYSIFQPGYIRVYADAGNLTGTMTVSIFKHDCRSDAQRCPLKPGGPAINIDPTSGGSAWGYFVAKNPIMADGLNLNTRLTVTFNVPGVGIRGVLRNPLNNIPIGSSNPFVRTTAQASGSVYKFQVQDVSAGVRGFNVKWTTDATLIGNYDGYGSAVGATADFLCTDETGLEDPIDLFDIEPGSDESKAFITVDDPPYPGTRIAYQYKHDIDTGEKLNPLVQPKAFRNNASFQVHEMVGGEGGGLDNAGAHNVLSLGFDGPERVKQQNSFDVGSGVYKVKYSLVRSYEK